MVNKPYCEWTEEQKERHRAYVKKWDARHQENLEQRRERYNEKHGIPKPEKKRISAAEISNYEATQILRAQALHRYFYGGEY